MKNELVNVSNELVEFMKLNSNCVNSILPKLQFDSYSTLDMEFGNKDGFLINAKIKYIYLKIDLIEFLQFLYNNGITIKNHIEENYYDRFEFLSYLESWASDSENYILEQIFNSDNLSNKYGYLEENRNKYLIGTESFSEYDCYFKTKNGFMKKTYVRIPSSNKNVQWCKVDSLKWGLKNNCIVTRNPIIIDDRLLKISWHNCNSKIVNINELERYINNHLYTELLYHPETFLSSGLNDKIKLYYYFYKNKHLLNLQKNSFNENKIKKLKK